MFDITSCRNKRSCTLKTFALRNESSPDFPPRQVTDFVAGHTNLLGYTQMLRTSSYITRRSAAAITTRFYTTKPRVANLTQKPLVPVTETRLSDGSIFVTREQVVPTSVQATAPPLNPRSEKKNILSQDQIEEMRRLRQEDPTTWTRKKLAKKFNCSELFVSIAAPLDKATRLEKEKQQQQQSSGEEGYRRQMIKINRQRRRAMW